MTIPLVILSFFAITVGLLGSPLFHHAFQSFVLDSNAVEMEGGMETNYFIMGLSTLISLAGIGLAYLIYVANQKILPESLRLAFTPLYRLLFNKYYIDEIYEAVFIQPTLKLCQLFFKFDLGVIDDVVNAVGRVVQWYSSVLRKLQSGLVQNYLLVQVIGIIIFILTFIGKLCFRF